MSAVLKVWFVDSRSSKGSFGGSWGQDYFHNNAKRLFAFSQCVDICTDYAKAMVGKLLASGARIQLVALVVKKKKVNFLEKEKWLISQNPAHPVNILCDKMGRTFCVLCWIPKYNGSLYEKHMNELQAELVAFILKESHYFLKEWLTNYSYLVLSIWQMFSQKWTK